jgi:hypothetical protein
MSDRNRRRPTPRRPSIGDEPAGRLNRGGMWDDGSQTARPVGPMNSRSLDVARDEDYIGPDPNPGQDPQPRQLRRDSTARALYPSEYKKGGTVKKLATGGMTGPAGSPPISPTGVRLQTPDNPMARRAPVGLANRIATARGRMAQFAAQPRGLRVGPGGVNGPRPPGPPVAPPPPAPVSDRDRLGFSVEQPGTEVSGGNKKGGFIKKGQKPAKVVKKSPMKKGKK